jgi:hypothetical protein
MTGTMIVALSSGLILNASFSLLSEICLIR